MSDTYIGTDDRGMPRFAERYSGWGAAPSPSSRVLPQVSEEAARTIGGGIFEGVWRRFSRGVRGEPAPTSPFARAGQVIVDIADTGRQIGQFYDETRAAYGTAPPQGTFPSMEGPQWRGYRDGGLGGQGDAEQILRSMDPGMVARLQDRLVSAGFMSGGAFAVGSPVDDKTVEAFRGLLGYANSQGTVWQAALGVEETGVGEDGGGGRAPFVAPTYVAPDYATLAQSVKDHFRKTLGREADESELAIFTAELSGWDREAFEAEAAAMRSEYEAAEQGRDAPAVQQAVDPLARFKESFEKRFEGALRGQRRMEEAAQASESVRAATSLLSRMSGGMG
jgi:hypothetical protein